MTWLGVGSTLLLAAAVVAQRSDRPASAAPADDTAAPTAPASGAPGAGTTAAGVRAFIDPATGKLTANPSHADIQRMALQSRTLGGPAIATSRSMVGLKPFQLAHGGRGVNLQGRFQTAMRVERAADGSLHLTCGDVHPDGEAPAGVGSNTSNAGSGTAGAASGRPVEAPLQ